MCAKITRKMEKKIKKQGNIPIHNGKYFFSVQTYAFDVVVAGRI